MTPAEIEITSTRKVTIPDRPLKEHAYHSFEKSGVLIFFQDGIEIRAFSSAEPLLGTTRIISKTENGDLDSKYFQGEGPHLVELPAKQGHVVLRITRTK